MQEATLKSMHLNEESGDLHFMWLVREEEVEVVVSWEFGNSIPNSLAGTAQASAVTRVLRPFFYRYRAVFHRMLVKGRLSYEAGPWASLNPPIPRATTCSTEGIDPHKRLILRIEVDGCLVRGTLEPDLSWNCELADDKYSEWATAWHAALDYIIEHRDEAAQLGFDTREIDRQLANLDVDVVADWNAAMSASGT